MTESFLNGKVTLHRGDCLEVLPLLEENSIDSCVTDPPYHLTSIVKRFGQPNSAPVKVDRFCGHDGADKGVSPYARSSKGFMGKQWDGGDVAFRPEIWAEVLRVLKPGAHLLAFSGTRTYHRMACAIEDAGFEIRDQIGWCYGSGFPKSHDVAKSIDRMNGVEREDKFEGSFERRAGPTGNRKCEVCGKWLVSGSPCKCPRPQDTAKSESAIQWQGWGTALKPSFEPLVFAQKPLDLRQNFHIMGSHLRRLESRLWSMLSASVAAKFFELSQSEFDAACASAQWSADEKSSTRAALSAQMATSQFASALTSSLNTVFSWNGIWAAASALENTSIIETELGTTIGLRTLRSLLSKITPESIILAHKSGSWSIANASHAERVFDAVAKRLSGTLELSALASATALEADSSLDAGVKPSWDCIVLARKPLSESSIAAKVLKHGTGGLNVDGCRVSTGEDMSRLNGGTECLTWGGTYGAGANVAAKRKAEGLPPQGRWPANLIHDGSEEVLAGFPDLGTTANSYTRQVSVGNKDVFKGGNIGVRQAGYEQSGFGDSGSAARFFYTAKADADDRLGSKHPTVKPLDLIQYLIRLVTPSGGHVLDPFAGTGTCGEAAWREGARCVLIEREAEYQSDIVKRMGLCLSGPDTRKAASTKQLPPDDLPMFGGGI